MLLGEILNSGGFIPSPLAAGEPWNCPIGGEWRFLDWNNPPVDAEFPLSVFPALKMQLQELGAFFSVGSEIKV